MPFPKHNLTASIIYFIFLSTLLLSPSLHAKEIRIITPYVGTVKNIHQDNKYNLDLKDSSLLRGLYFQWLNSEKYQWNIFLYNSEDLNYSTLWGVHLIFDYYFNVQEAYKDVIGAGFEFIGLDMKADDNFSPLSNFKMVNNIYVPYIRGGRYFLFGSNDIKFSILSWLGFESEFVRGDLSFNTPWPPFSKSPKINSDYHFALAGINLKASICHFFEVKAKHSLRFDSNERLHTTSVMGNLYLHKNWGISYRFKFSENIFGSNTYHMGGVSYIF